MTDKKYIGVYYPDCFIDNPASLTIFSLFYDEIHLITMSDMSKDPTGYLKRLPSTININVFGSPSDEVIEKTKRFYQFALNNQELLGKVLYFHPHLLDGATTSISDKLLKGCLAQEDLFDFIAGATPEQELYNDFVKKHPEVKDEFVLRSSPTAIKLAKDNDWVLLSDNPNLPVPYLSEKVKAVKYLTSILAEECINISIPKSISLNAEDILKAREKLEEQLIPFRMAMQKLSATLKSVISGTQDIKTIKSEAKFIAESQVEPAVFELKRKIEIEKNKLWITIFGKVVSWIPIVAKAFAAPTPDDVFRIMGKTYGDVGDIANSINNIDIAKEPGICYLLKLDNILTEK